MPACMHVHANAQRREEGGLGVVGWWWGSERREEREWGEVRGVRTGRDPTCPLPEIHWLRNVMVTVTCWPGWDNNNREYLEQ